MRILSFVLLLLIACEGPPPTRDVDRPFPDLDALLSDSASLDMAADSGLRDAIGDLVDSDLDHGIEMGLGVPILDALPSDDLGGLIPDTALDMSDAVAFDLGLPDEGPRNQDAMLTDMTASPDPLRDGMVVMPVDGGESPPPHDAGLPFDSEVAPIDSAQPTGFVSGTVRAMDGLTRVTIRAGDLATQAEAEDFRLGPLAPGRYALIVEAEGHQSETVVVDVEADAEVSLPAEVILFRGRRVAGGTSQRFFFRGDGEWLLWTEEEALFGASTAAPRATRYLADGFEVFFGFDASRDVFHLRRRAQPGVAGDIIEVDLQSGEVSTLFVEAQPWLGRVADRYLAMVQTRAAHSRLESRRAGGPAIVLGTDVPWLSVTTLSDGELAWTTQLEDGYAVWIGTADGAVAQRVEPRNIPATDDFLMRIWPDGLAWRGVDGALWRWGDDTDRLIEDIAARPLPRFIGIDEALAWRPDDVDHTILYHRDGVTRPLVTGVSTQPFLHRARQVFAHRVGEGLWVGDLDGDDPGLVVPGTVETLVMTGAGVLALVDGVVWRWAPEIGAVRLAGPALTRLSYAPGGATVWQPDTGTLFYLGAGGPAVALVEGAPVHRPIRASNEALYVRSDDTHRYVTLADGEGVEFDRPVDALTVLSATQVLGVDAENTLWSIDGPAGTSMGWALGVSRVGKSANGAWVAYACERGIFLVPTAP